jgi:hypothetical protein
MAEWEKLWKCKNCGNWNDDSRAYVRKMREK